MAKKSIPETHLLQCEKCDLILRFTEDEFDDLHELPTFCHLIPESDHEARRKACPRPKFKKPRGV